VRLLLSNDDGIASPGLRALREALQDLGEVWVVAPDREQSAASHSISLHRPLRLDKLGEREFAVDGTPTDCVYVALNHLMAKSPPDLVVSGINHGPNLGDDITYSGTVAAAFEAVILGVPAFAVSLVARPPRDFSAAARFSRALAEALAKTRLPRGTLLNVNVPAGAGERYKITRMGKRSYGNLVEERTDPRGRRYYWIGGDEAQHEGTPGSDCHAIYDEKIISVTPLQLDLTSYALIDELRGWTVGGFQRAESF
jgi:5'-nucleotidase